MDGNFERIKTVLLHILLLLSAFILLGVLISKLDFKFDFFLYKINSSFMIIGYGMGRVVRMKYCINEFKDNENFLKLLMSDKVSEFQNLDNVIIYKIKSKYSLWAMKFSVSYIDEKTVVNGPKFLEKIFKEYDIS